MHVTRSRRNDMTTPAAHRQASNKSKALKLALAAGIVTAILVGAIGRTESASAQRTGYPCGFVLLKGTDWLGGRGVDVHLNTGGRDDNGNWSIYNSCGTPAQWQCVELVNRLYKSRGW